MCKKSIVIVFICTALFGFKIVKEYTFVIPKNFGKPNYDFQKNPLNEATIQLGRALFYDPILSKNNSISCTSCHSPYNAFAHTDHSLSHGIDDSIGTRNAPALMNLAWQKSFMWDGAINHIDMQALAPISNKIEMNETIENIVKKLEQSTLYPSLFFKAYGDKNITGERILKAIAQFQLTLISSDSKYDSVMRKQTTFNAQEKKGYELFKQNCNSCHTEPLFTNHTFANNGLAVDTALNDFGRWNITHQSSDSLKFKVPTLRNIEFTYPYMHDGRFKKISDVLNHYTKNITASPTLAPELKNNIALTSNEKVDLTAFLLTLSDKHFVFNPDFAYPKNIFSVSAKDKK